MTYRLPILLLALLTLAGCFVSDRQELPTSSAEPTAAQTSKVAEDVRLKKAKESAAAETDPIKKAEKEIAALRLERDIAQRDANTAIVLIGQKESELREAKLGALQTKLYIGSGALGVIALILCGLAFYFRSAHMVYWAAATIGLAGLVAFAGFLTPYAVYIAIACALAFVGFLCWLLLGRDKALFQLTKAVDTIKPLVPGYKGIVREYVDTAQDAIIDATRRRWRDPTV